VGESERGRERERTIERKEELGGETKKIWKRTSRRETQR